jgi:hypothetical protein
LKTEAAAFAEQEQAEETDAAAFATETNLEFGDSEPLQPADSYAAFEQYDAKETFEDGEGFAIPTVVLTEEEPAAAAAESGPEPADAAAPAQSTFVFGPKIFGEESEAPVNAEPEALEESGASDAAEEEPAEEYAPERPPFILEPEVAESPEVADVADVAEEDIEPEAAEELEAAEDAEAESEIDAEAEATEEAPEDIEPEIAEEEPADIAPEVTEYEPARSIFGALPETSEEESETTKEAAEDVEADAEIKAEEEPEIAEPEAESEIDAEAEAAEEVPEWAPVEEEQGTFTDELGTEYEPEEKPDWLRELEQLTQAFPLKGADPLRPAAAPPESLEYETGESETAEFATAGFEIEEAEAVPETPEEEAAETEEETALEGFTFDSPLSHSTPPTREEVAAFIDRPIAFPFDEGERKAEVIPAPQAPAIPPRTAAILSQPLSEPQQAAAVPQPSAPQPAVKPQPQKKEPSNAKRNLLSVAITVLIVVLVVIVSALAATKFAPDSTIAFYVHDFWKLMQEKFGSGS